MIAQRSATAALGEAVVDVEVDIRSQRLEVKEGKKNGERKGTKAEGTMHCDMTDRTTFCNCV